jgi:hypothetical protein
MTAKRSLRLNKIRAVNLFLGKIKRITRKIVVSQPISIFSQEMWVGGYVSP